MNVPVEMINSFMIKRKRYVSFWNSFLRKISHLDFVDNFNQNYLFLNFFEGEILQDFVHIWINNTYSFEAEILNDNFYEIYYFISSVVLLKKSYEITI